jgi:phosphoribosylformimino-5-aminoimidazole carboxamide ribotide isomerase
MLIIPAIDILGGECVRLYMGDYDSVEVFEANPVEMARRFQDAGAKRIHIVDLDAARSGSSQNRRMIRRIQKAVDCDIEIGGGIRTEEDVDHLLELGVNRLVLGTILAKDPAKVERWASKYGDVFIAGIDALGGNVKVNGWEKESGITDVELAKRCADIGVISIIYTDISRDGTLEGPDIDRTKMIAKESGLPVILSGGIGSDDDIKEICSMDYTGITGIIVGKAIYKTASICRTRSKGTRLSLTSGASGESGKTLGLTNCGRSW